jgi:hypothetical protein
LYELIDVNISESSEEKAESGDDPGASYTFVKRGDEKRWSFHWWCDLIKDRDGLRFGEDKGGRLLHVYEQALVHVWA